ncbi:unnamed protein product [Gemmataceae bacterium]|nr:unnamed protein product [Gemmataceae bacterium]VTT96585.1 unnamed protein product [Gemmataceae bacterium]
MSLLLEALPWLVAAGVALRHAAVARRYRDHKSPEEFARLTADAVLATRAAWQAEATLRGEYERRGRLMQVQKEELDSLRDQLTQLLHRTVTEADVAELRQRLHRIRGAAQ